MKARRADIPEIEAPTASFRRDDEEWIATVAGRTRSGGRADPGVALLFLTFARADEPDEPLFELLRPGRRLEDFSEDQLTTFLDEARPYEAEWERSRLFPGTRKERGRGG